MSDAAETQTLDELLAIPDDTRLHELIGGRLVREAGPSGEHGDAQAGVVGAVRPRYQGPPGDGPGGWWIATEVEVLLDGGDVARTDVGWRRARVPARPTGAPVRARPDGVCEVLWPSHANVDTVEKLRLHHRAAIPHHWLADPRDAPPTVMRWADAGCTTVQPAERGETLRPEPFDAVALPVGALFGDDG
ncbi:MAG TPA: Uma2 family endonuclease [Sandaracinaceae bacterium LLY-WYZ-13_1]|nr:Uma2 family endonuclease [Sandaracinaceae bacterium LLY-WYZ-13_1]